MSELLQCVEVGPTSGTANSAIVWLHGLGASGHDFEPIVPALGLPDTRFVFPHAPTRPVTINMGFVMPAWYDILSLDFSGAREAVDDVKASTVAIEALLERERERGITPERTILAGFSQGGAMALYAGLRHAHPLAGILVLSAYELQPDATATELHPANQSTPLMFAHGRMDPVVPVAYGRRAHDAVASLDGERTTAWRDYGMGHEVCPEEVRDVGEWLRARLST